MLRYNQFIKEGSDEDLLIIKDVFQDIIDEWDLYDSSIYRQQIGKFYKIFKRGDMIVFQIWSESSGHFQQSDFLNKIDLSGHIRTLESMGYSVKNKTLKWSIVKNIDSRFSILSGKEPNTDEVMLITLEIRK